MSEQSFVYKPFLGWCTQYFGWNYDEQPKNKWDYLAAQPVLCVYSDTGLPSFLRFKSDPFRRALFLENSNIQSMLRWSKQAVQKFELSALRDLSLKNKPQNPRSSYG